MKAIRLFFIIVISLGGVAYLGYRYSSWISHSHTPLSNLSNNPTDQWLAENAPKPLTGQPLQTLYDTFIKGYWVPKTGLFLSFPGSGDRRLTQQSALYDQGIAGILLLAVGDTERAQKMLDFFAKTWKQADNRGGPRKGMVGFSNFYNAYYGVEGIEKTMHVGPNAWIGLLAARAHRQTGNAADLQLALKIAHWMIEKVPHMNGAIAMGQIAWNGVPWPGIYSTENNLSTYAFLSDLLKSTDLPANERTLIEHERTSIGHWLITQAYQPSTQRVIRGFNEKELDTAGAIDSYTWYTDTLQPATLQAAGVPVDQLVGAAESDYTVTVNGRQGVDCVDGKMADKTYTTGIHDPLLTQIYMRPADDGHRLIWYEGTGQFIVLLKDVAHWTVQRAMDLPEGTDRSNLLSDATRWLNEAQHYIDEMDAASMSLPWGKAYPCATAGQFYVYGWPAPPGAENHLSDAVAAIIWRIYAGMGYEPMSDRWLSAPADHHVQTRVQGDAENPHTDILYGASEEMTMQAWKLFDAKDYKRARAQAQATITLWNSYAHELEKKKASTDKGFLNYDGTVNSFQAIAAYWALNDVASCYFILGRIDDSEHHTTAALQDFSTILHDYPLAQIWDPKGWFWNPVDAIKTDYAQGNTPAYHSLLHQIPTFPPAR